MANTDRYRPYADLPFAMYLDRKMEEMNLSPKKIAAIVKVDERLIRAWRTGERLGQLEKLPGLAQALQCSYKELEEHLIESIKKKPSRKSRTIFSSPLNGGETSISCEKLSNDLNQQVIRDRSKLNMSMISMIESLGEPDSESHEILIVLQSKHRTLDDEARDRWHQSLGDAIKKGWTVHHIIQVGRDLDRILFAVSNILRFIDNSEKYNLYKFKQKGSPIAAHGMIVIPGKSALICTATKNEDYLDSGIYLNANGDSEQIEVYRERFELLKKQSESVYEKFDRYQQPELLEAFSRSDQESGSRTVILKRISEIHRPLYFYAPDSDWVKALRQYFSKFTEDEFEEHIKTRKKRHNEILKRLNESRYRYIYYKSCFEEFVETGKAYPHYFTATPQQRLDQLKEIENLLLNSPNFEIALVEGDEENMVNIKPIFCEVKEGITAVMEVPCNDHEGNIDHKWCLIKDPTITRALEEHLLQLWDRLRATSKDQISVLRWFRQKIQTLEDKIRLSDTNSI
jgi:hypothetical protein